MHSQTNLPENSKNNNTNATTSFKGGKVTAGVVAFWTAVASGGLAASFTLQDMLGTSFPRTYSALQRNKDITGKDNYMAATEVAIREVTTGPSMFIVPALVLAIASRSSGSANKVSVENIKDMSDTMQGSIEKLAKSPIKIEDAQLIKKEFYKDTLEKIFNQNERNVLSPNIDEFIEEIFKYEDKNTPKRNVFEVIGGKDSPKGRAKDQILDNLVDKFTEIKKANTYGYDNFASAKLTKESGSCSFERIVKDMKSYSDDFCKTYFAQKAKQGSAFSNDAFLSKFKNLRCGSKFLTNAMIVIGTGLFMSFIPKLYTISKTNPETEALYAHVGKSRKGPVNEVNK